MAHLTTHRLCTMVLVGALFASSASLAQTTAKTQPVDSAVSEVVVTGKRQPPGGDQPKSATCEFLVASDPFLRAQMMVGQPNPILSTETRAEFGFPPHEFFGARMFLPTRAPMNPDLKAAPLTAPGSALPDIGPQRRTALASTAPGALDASTPVTEASALDGLLASALNFPLEEATVQTSTDLDTALNLCRGSRGGDNPWQRGRTARRDKTLPTGMALFEHGRYEEALAFFKQAHGKLSDANGGDEAALMVGKIYLLALGEKSDAETAVTWLKKAAGVKFNPFSDMPVFDPKAPDRNTPIGEAALLLGRVYLVGSGSVEKDPVEARKWLLRAAEVGHVPAYKTLGDIYYYGHDVPKDRKKAFGYYKQAATLGHAPAQYALAEMLYRGEHGGASDPAKALGWYNEAAKLEHPGAMYALALAYDTGDGVPANPERALGFYKAAALQRNRPAQTAMGTYFYEGKQVAKNDAIARKWFETAALRGDPDAMFNLGAMLMKGEGGDRDLAKAWAWFKVAQEVGNPNAPAALRAVEKRMSPDERRAAQQLLSPSKS